MIQATDLFPKVGRLWGSPSIQELSPQSLKDAFERVFSLVSLKLSTSSTSLNASISDFFTLSDDENYEGAMPQSITASGILSIQYRTSGGASDHYWNPLTIGVIENWDYYKAGGEPAGIFFSGASGILHLKTNFNPNGFEFRVFYISDALNNGSVSLPDFFSPLFEYGMASEVSINPDEANTALKESVKGNRNEFLNKYLFYTSELDKWVRKSRARKGVSKRMPSNAARRHTGLHYDRWKLGEPR